MSYYAHENGIDSQSGLEGIRFVSGKIFGLAPIKPNLDELFESNTKASILIQNVFCLGETKSARVVRSNDPSVWNKFSDKHYYWNLYKLDAKAVLEMNCEGYAGATAVFDTDSAELELIYYNDWQCHCHNESFMGRIILPRKLETLIRKQLTKLAVGEHWHGDPHWLS